MNKIHFKDLNLLILHFPEKSYHFLVQGQFKYEYHEGEEFTKFLKANDVPCAEYEIEEIIDESKGLYKKKNGSELNISPGWIQTGYVYTIEDPDGAQPTLGFQTGKIGIIKVLERYHQKDKVEVEFTYQGDFNDPEIQKFLKGVKSARRGNKVARCIMVILIVVAFILIGKLFNWIFGEPDDPYLNMIIDFTQQMA